MKEEIGFICKNCSRETIIKGDFDLISITGICPCGEVKSYPMKAKYKVRER